MPGQFLLFFYTEFHFFWREPLVQGNFAAWGRTFPRKSDFLNKPLSRQLRCQGQNFFSEIALFFEQATCAGQLRCLGQNFFSKIEFFFEQTSCPGQLRCLGQKCFSQKSNLFLNKPLVAGNFAAWGSFCSKNRLSGLMGLLCAEQNVGNPNKRTFRISGTPVRRTKRQKSQTNVLSRILGRRTKRRKSQQIDFQELWDSCAQNKTLEIQRT